MQVFYAPDIAGDFYTLDENESKHLIRVLRMTKGSAVRLIDGKGNLYEGQIEEPDQRKCRILITGVQKDYGLRDYNLHIAISPLKNNDRFEWFIEKSVEIGIDKITPLICRNTERQGIKPERINSIIVSAMKQSLKTIATTLSEPVKFNDFISGQINSNMMIAHCNGSFERKKISEVYRKGNNAVILIGPEGDFTEEEIMAAYAADCSGIHLGKSRLRTETAGLAACHSIYFINS
jgi:16S rRNA (uracil1498-N3)-methyltransferase